MSFVEKTLWFLFFALVSFHGCIAAVTSKACYKFVGTPSDNSKLNFVQDYYKGMDFYGCLDFCEAAGLADTTTATATGIVGVASFKQLDGGAMKEGTGGRCFCAKTKVLPAADVVEGPTDADLQCKTDCYMWGTRGVTAGTTGVPLMKCGSIDKEYTMASIYEVYKTKNKGVDVEVATENSKPDEVVKKRKCLKDLTTAGVGASAVQNHDSFFFIQSHNLNKPEHCARLCYNAFGAQFSGLSQTLCFCAYVLPPDGPNWEDKDKCKENCPGNSAKFCGDAKERLTVYKHVPGKAPTEIGKTELVSDPPSVKSKSCYKIGNKADKLKVDEYQRGWNIWGWTYNRKNCWDSCRKVKEAGSSGTHIFNFAGLVAGKICFCAKGEKDATGTGYKLPDDNLAFVKDGTAAECTSSIDCLFKEGSVKADNQKCGGFFRLQAFTE